MLDRFGDVLAEALKRKQPGATVELLQRERKKARRAPLIIVASCRARKDSKIPEIEQLSSAAAAAQNIMLAAHALGYGAMWKTGDAAYDDEVKRALGLDSADAIVGFIYLGIRTEPSKPLPTRPAPEAREFVTEWKA